MLVSVWGTRSQLFSGLSTAFDLMALATATLMAVAAVYVLGASALLWSWYIVGLWLALFWPRQFILLAFAAIIALEPDPIDFTAPISDAVYSRELIGPIIPITIQPLEIMIVTAAGSLLLRRPTRELAPVRLPLLVWAVPIVITLGYLYGWYRGGPSNLAYVESRGLLFGVIAFFVAMHLRDTSPRVLLRTLIIANVVLASIVLMRYVFYTRPGLSNVPKEFHYDHVDVIFLGIGLAIGAALLARPQRMSSRLLLIAYTALTVAAILGTGRRSGTLVIAVAILIMVWMLFPKRPVLVFSLVALTAVFGGLYLGAYWNKEYGALAQPARAIRSQIGQPSARDVSSDQYRAIERVNVTTTIRSNKIFGVGFGREFIVFVSLPEMPWWSLQFMTPHNDILWLWLKMGIAGVGVMLGVWVLALKRCLLAFRAAPRGSPPPLAPLIVAAALVSFLAFAQFDLVLPGPRPTMALGATLAAAFILAPSEARSSERA